MVMTEVTFEAFFRKEYLALVALGAWLTGERPAGEDLAQDALMRVHRRWAEVGRYERPDAFARRVLINLASNERRRRGRESAAVARLGETPQDCGAVGEHDRALWDAVAALPFQQRAAIALRYLDNLSTPGIADTLGCSESTVRVHLHRAHHRLAERLGETTRTEEDAR